MNLTTKVVLFFCTLTLNSCVTKPFSVNTDYWTNLVKSEQFKTEKKRYLERLGGKRICWNEGVTDFFEPTASPPNKDCIYPSSKFITKLDDGMIFQNKVLGQKINQLKVLQTTPDGFVITSPSIYKDQVIYIHKTEEGDIVDGTFLDTDNWFFYEYAGIYRYQTAIGSKTVHSFKRRTKTQRETANKDLEVYNPIIEYWVDNNLWSYLENFAVPYSNKSTNP